MQERFELLFLVYADEKYELFVTPYIWFALSTNPESAVEVVLKNKKGFEEKRYESLKLLKKQFGDRFRLTQSTYGNSNIIPNTIRFIETPTIKAKHLYIGDIDILVLQNVMDVHTEIMEVNDMSYSNKIRNKDDAKPRMTGLHFCKYDDYYPLPPLDGISLETENDEHVLYLLLRAKNIDINYENRTRPLCGLHVSLNRDPFGRTSGFCNKSFKTTNNVKWGD
ncbi:hypothetical protein [Alteromonas gracilis]|uniref:hypothetical protein n=1 Tax=Alteromonas gracilis TaxID=1479524 RepID=UPI00321C0AA8